MCASHDECSVLSVSLEVDTGDQRLVHQDRQRVITELPLRGGCVNLNSIIEVEQAGSPLTVPRQRIERGQNCRRLNRLSGHLEIGRRVGDERLPRLVDPPFNSHLHHVAGFDTRFERNLCGSASHSVVIGDIGKRGHPERPHRVSDECAARVEFGNRNGAKVLGHNLFDGGVNALKVSSTDCCDHTVVEQLFERAFRVAPVPPRSARSTPVTLELAKGRRAILEQSLQQCVGEGAVLRQPLARLRVQLSSRLHLPLPQRPGLERDKRRFVNPVFEVRCGCVLGQKEVVKSVRRVIAESREQGQIVTTFKHVNGVELENPHSRNRL